MPRQSSPPVIEKSRCNTSTRELSLLGCADLDQHFLSLCTLFELKAFRLCSKICEDISKKETAHRVLCLLRPFIGDKAQCDKFLGFLEVSESIVMGSVALQVLMPSISTSNTLELAIPGQYALWWISKLRKFGWSLDNDQEDIIEVVPGDPNVLSQVLMSKEVCPVLYMLLLDADALRICRMCC